MGTFYQQLAQHLPPTTSQNIIVEIGSEMGEGSTDFLCDLARKKAVPFYSVDVFCAKHRVRPETVSYTVWQQMPGSTWAREILPSLQKKISLLYLDNFDYTWDIKQPRRDQEAYYQDQLGWQMNNRNCQIEHMKQMLYCMPYMSDHALVCFDDTYTWNDCWVGKSGPAVVWLLSQDWRILQEGPGSVILARS